MTNCVVVVQWLSCVEPFVTPWTAAHQASLSFTISWGWLRCMSIELVMLTNHLILCNPLLLPSIFPSIKVFSNELVLHIRWPKYWSFSFSISPSNEYSGFPLGLTGLISLLSKGLSSLLQHNLKASIIWLTALFRVSLVAQTVKASACNAGDPGSIPGSGRYPGEGNGNTL